MKAALILPALLLCGSCSLLPTVTLNSKTRVQNPDGTVEESSTHWQGRIDELPEGLSKMGDHLAQTTGKLVDVLTEVPPPGRVRLAELGPGLARFEGQAATDFLLAAKDSDGKPIEFKFVQIGVPSYDEFFRRAQVVYATCYQLNATQQRLIEVSGKLLETDLEASGELKAAVDRALKLEGRAGVDASLVAQLHTLHDLALATGVLAVQLVGQITQLVSSGHALVAGAAGSITNPKVVLHIDLIKDGLIASVDVIQGSAVLLGDLAASLGGFGDGAEVALNKR